MKVREAIALLFEAGLLKHTPRAGWLTIGIKDCESVAEHCWRTAVTGFVLAGMEGADARKTALLCLFHDFHEARMGDIHALAGRYLTKNAAKAAEDVARGHQDILALWREFEFGESKEAVVARDADALEMLLQAKEYVDEGKPLARDWIKSALAKLKTPSAKKIASLVLAQGSRDWMFRAYWQAAKD
ncbi:MAG: HD domain-containing protein [Candidatus Micrarchaeia archaeon]